MFMSDQEWLVKVLIVDQDKEQRKFLKENLGDQDFEILSFGHSSDGNDPGYRHVLQGCR